MNSNSIVQFDKIEIKNISIGKKYEKGQPEFQTKDLSVLQDLFVNRNANILKNLVIGQEATTGNDTGAVTIKGSLSVSGNTYLGDTIQTTEIRNNIVVKDKLSSEEVTKVLLPIKGIGQWTINNFKIFALQDVNAWPSADLALQEAVKILKNLIRRPNQLEMEKLGKNWEPYRGAAALFLWHFYNKVKMKSSKL